MLKTYYLISLDLKIVLTTLHKGEGGGKNHCYRRERANKLLVSTIFARAIASKNNETLSHFGDLFQVRAPLPPLTMLKTYYLISLDLKIVLTTLHKGEGGGKNHCYRRERANKLLVSTIFARDCLSRGLFVVPNFIKFLPKIELKAVSRNIFIFRDLSPVI